MKVSVLAFEGGATHTKCAVVSDGQPHILVEAGPCNPTAYGIAASARALIDAGTRALAAHTGPPPSVAAIGSAGAVDDAQRRALGEAVCAHFGLERAVVATDLHPLLLANAWDRTGVLAIAGTGSNVLARDAAGHLSHVGGRGTLLGDDGSGYMIAAEALRRAARAEDGWGPPTTLTTILPAAAGVPNFDALIAWGAAASKRDIAALSRNVLHAAMDGDAVALAVVQEEAALLAEQVLAAVKQLGESAATLDTVYGVGGLFERYPLYVDAFNARLALASPLRYAAPPVTGPAAVAVLARLSDRPDWAAFVERGQQSALPGTESADAGAPLDALDAAGITARMLSAEARVATCLARAEGEIAALVAAAAAALAASGRVLYFGAGTSGRLGVLDAAECGPTFGVGEETIRAFIAGGDHALRHAAEGAEDDAEAGARDVASANVSAKDLVVGIAASGSTPYVRGALAAAAAHGARTALIACVATPAIPADIVVALDTGAEALPGSTRLKAGTATKIVLNTVSTGAMALSGRIYEGRMVAMRASNTKLRARAERMLAELTGVSSEVARDTLEATNYDIRTAILMAMCGIDQAEARRRLSQHGGRLRAALSAP